jgi:hypothetical protein
VIEKITLERVTGIEPAWPAWKAGYVTEFGLGSSLMKSGFSGCIQ